LYLVEDDIHVKAVFVGNEKVTGFATWHVDAKVVFFPDIGMTTLDIEYHSGSNTAAPPRGNILLYTSILL